MNHSIIWKIAIAFIVVVGATVYFTIQYEKHQYDPILQQDVVQQANQGVDFTDALGGQGRFDCTRLRYWSDIDACQVHNSLQP